MTHEQRGEPERTCVGCRRRASARVLVRLHCDASGALRVGPGDGRGAWLCAPPAGVSCLDDAARRGALERALRRPVQDRDVARVRATLEGPERA